ncbi:hypothetical protein RUND412_004282 [Rhizina undulata]
MATFSFTMNDKVIITCMLLGGEFNQSFKVEVDKDSDIDELKKDIKEGSKPRLNHVHATDLILWKGFISFDDKEALRNSDPTKTNPMAAEQSTFPKEVADLIGPSPHQYLAPPVTRKNILRSVTRRNGNFEFVADLVVKYGKKQSEASVYRVRALDVALDDINAGFGGGLVRLARTKVYSGHSSGQHIFQLFYDDQKHPDRSELFRSVGGKYRYIEAEKRPEEKKKKTTDVALLRSWNRVDLKAALGYDGMSCNINEGRERDYLYLVWKCVQA